MKSVLTLQDLQNRYGVGRQSIWRWRQSETFPKPISPPVANPFWKLEDIESWETSNTMH